MIQEVLDGGTKTAIAARLGIGRRTLGRYLDRPDVQSVLAEEGKQALSMASRGLQTAMGEAMVTARKLLRCPLPTVQLGAVRVVLEFGMKVAEADALDDLRQRIQEVKELVSGGKG